MRLACAVAMHFAENVVSDRWLKSRYGVASTTDVRSRWVSGKLAELLKLDADALPGIEAKFWPSEPPPAAANGIGNANGAARAPAAVDC